MSNTATTDSAQRPINALLLDDDDFDRRRLCRMARATGLELHFEPTGTIQEMMGQLSKRSYDIIFLDYRLTNETGLQALDHIRTNDRNADTATVMVSGHAQVDIAVSALKSGCHDYLDKGALTPDLLRQTITTVLGKEVDIAPRTQEIDRALLELANAKLPHLLMQLLQSDAARDHLGPYLESLVERSVSKVMSSYDLPDNPGTRPEIQDLLLNMRSSDQISYDQN